MRTTAKLDQTPPDIALWLFDHDLWVDSLGGWSQELQTVWEQSPGHCVLQAEGDLAEVHWDLWNDHSALHRAVGVHDLPPDDGGFVEWFSSHNMEWQALHATIPGACLARWRPEGVTAGEALAEALSVLVEANLWWGRGVALGWLLGGQAR